MSERRGPSAANVAPSGARTVMDAHLERLAVLSGQWPEGTMALAGDRGAVRVVAAGLVASDADPSNEVRLREGTAFLAGETHYIAAAGADGSVDGYSPDELQRLVPADEPTPPEPTPERHGR